MDTLRFSVLSTTVSYTNILQRYLEKWLGKHITNMHIQYIEEHDIIQIEFNVKDEPYEQT